MHLFSPTSDGFGSEQPLRPAGFEPGTVFETET